MVIHIFLSPLYCYQTHLCGGVHICLGTRLTNVAYAIASCVEQLPTSRQCIICYIKSYKKVSIFWAYYISTYSYTTAHLLWEFLGAATGSPILFSSDILLYGFVLCFWWYRQLLPSWQWLFVCCNTNEMLSYS